MTTPVTPAAAPRLWRSALFVPADNPRVLAKAATRGADALIVDLEDAVASDRKPAARAALADTLAMLRQDGQAQVMVRVNNEPALLGADLAAAVRAGASAVMLPKVEEVQALTRIAQQLDALGATDLGVVALLETPAAMFAAASIAAAPRVVGLALGSEDFSREMGVAPSRASLIQPCRTIALAAAAHGLAALGLPISLAQFADLEAYASAAGEGRATGLTGALCIHPAQIAPINAAFGDGEAQLLWARAVLIAWKTARAEGRSVVAVNGEMIDAPVAARAAAIIERSDAS